MRVLSLDLSTHTGFAIFDGELGQLPKLVASGTVDLGKSVLDFGPYPHCYRKAAREMVSRIIDATSSHTNGLLIAHHVVIEEINSGRDRYVQKLLENIHTAACERLESFPITYLNSDGATGWRTHLGLKLTKDQKKANAKLSKAKREAEEDGVKLDKKKVGVRGKTTKKHLAIEWAKQNYKNTLKVKDNNEADAICIGAAFFMGAEPCDGT